MGHPRVRRSVGDLCRLLTQELDATYRQFLSDLGDLNQRLLNPRELIPSRSGTFAYSYNMALRTIIHLLRDHMEPMVSSFVEAHITDKIGIRHARRFTSSAISTLRYSPWHLGKTTLSAHATRMSSHRSAPASITSARTSLQYLGTNWISFPVL